VLWGAEDNFQVTLEDLGQDLLEHGLWDLGWGDRLREGGSLPASLVSPSVGVSPLSPVLPARNQNHYRALAKRCSNSQQFSLGY
jgi:hypothetical protein